MAFDEIRPEETHKGKIIILDFPVKEYLQTGVYAQGIYKYLWQQATERRDPNQDLLPVFLWVDESQLFLSDYDQIFQTTAKLLGLSFVTGHLMSVTAYSINIYIA